MNLFPTDKTFIIAELSANHGQCLDVAIETIRAAKRAGADAIKLQTYTADTMTLDFQAGPFVEVLDETIWAGRSLYDLYREAYTPWEWHEELFRVANEEGLVCFSSPFDKTAVDFLEQFDPPAYKIASFEITDIPLIAYTASKGRPMIMSTGIATLEDIELAVKTCRDAGNDDITLLKCVSSYPALVSESNLATIKDLKKRFSVRVGLSDHSVGSIVPVTAVALGAKVIEKHFILDKSIGGPDASFSMDEESFKKMVVDVRDAESAIGLVTYDLSIKTQSSRKFSRSLYASRDIKEGEVFTSENISSLRPCCGLEPKYYDQIIGTLSRRSISKGEPLLKKDLLID